METYKEFKKRITKEGYRTSCIYANYIYVIYTPDGRHTTGTLKEIKEFVGE